MKILGTWGKKEPAQPETVPICAWAVFSILNHKIVSIWDTCPEAALMARTGLRGEYRVVKLYGVAPYA